MNANPVNAKRDFAVVIAKLSAMYGFGEPPSDAILDFMFGFFKENYRTYTLEEIVTAGKLNLTGEVTSPDGKKIEHYGKLDIPFITSLLGGLQLRKTKAFKELQIKAASKEPAHVPSDPKEHYEGLIKFVEDYRDLPIGWDWSSVFDYMWSEKLFTDSPDQMKAWFKSKSAELIQTYTMRIKTASSLIERRHLEMSMSDDAIKIECRKIYIQNLFAPVKVEENKPEPIINSNIPKEVLYRKEFDAGKDSDGYIQYNGYELTWGEYLQVRTNEEKEINITTTI